MRAGRRVLCERHAMLERVTAQFSHIGWPALLRSVIGALYHAGVLPMQVRFLDTRLRSMPNGILGGRLNTAPFLSQGYRRD